MALLPGRLGRQRHLHTGAQPQFRRAQRQHLRGPLQRGAERLSPAVLRLSARRAGGARRELHHRHRQRGHRGGICPRDLDLSGRLPERVVLRRLLARLHLVPAGGHGRPSEREQPAGLRSRCAGHGSPRDRSERRPLLSRLGRDRRRDSTHLVRHRQQHSGGARGGRPHPRRGAAGRVVRRQRLGRRGQRAAHLRLGPRRGRRLRRLDRPRSPISRTRRPATTPCSSRSPTRTGCSTPTRS